MDVILCQIVFQVLTVLCQDTDSTVSYKLTYPIRFYFKRLFQVSYYVAEFWNTVSNVFIFAPPVFGIADALYQGGAKFNCEFHNLMYFFA